MLLKLRWFGVALLLLAMGRIVHAQETCSAIMQEAIELVSQTCSGTGRNEVCHGFFRVEAKDRVGADSLTFNVGDTIPVTELSALTTAPLNTETGEWGVALLRLQANLPDMLPGQNATFLLLGDTRLENDDTSPNARPLQIFRLETGITGVSCAEGPADGLLVQTPQDTQEVKLTVNGVTIEAAGTAFIQAQPGKEMTVSALDGTVEVLLGGERQVLEEGTQVTIPMDESLAPRGGISTPSAVQLSVVAGLPIELLPNMLDAPVLEASQDTLTNGDGETIVSVQGTPVDATATVAISPTRAVDVADETPATAEDVAAEGVDPREVILLFTVVVLVSFLIILLIVMVFMIIRTVIRQIRTNNPE
jgi:hypothetical protein